MKACNSGLPRVWESQGNLNFLKVRELSGNFENNRFKSNYLVNFSRSYQCFVGSLQPDSIQKCIL